MVSGREKRRDRMHTPQTGPTGLGDGLDMRKRRAREDSYVLKGSRMFSIMSVSQASSFPWPTSVCAPDVSYAHNTLLLDTCVSFNVHWNISESSYKTQQHSPPQALSILTLP